MASSTLILVSEYLKSSYRPDCDYVDGRIEERNLGEHDHAALQAELIFWFGKHQQEWNIEVLPEQRVQVPGPGCVSCLSRSARGADSHQAAHGLHRNPVARRHDDLHAGPHGRLPSVRHPQYLGDRPVETSRMAGERRGVGNGVGRHHAHRRWARRDAAGRRSASLINLRQVADDLLF